MVEVINHRGGSDQVECKVKGRLPAASEEFKGKALNLEAHNSVLYVHLKGTSKVQIYQTSDLDNLLTVNSRGESYTLTQNCT